MALKASQDDQAILLDLQSFDTKLEQLDHQAKALPQHAAIASIATEIEASRRTLAEHAGAVEDARLELTRIEADVAVVEARIARDTERVQQSSSVKDVAALEQELGALAKRLGDLEEIELTVMERLEELEATLAGTTAALDDLKARSAALEAERDAAIASIDAERTHARANRATVQSKVPAELLALYEKQRARYGIGASHLQHGVSKACGVRLNSHDLAAVRAAAPDDVLLCPESSAILVRTSESGL